MWHQYNGGGISVMGAMFLVFITLKLTDVIDWSWWWVTAPLWAAAVVFIIIAVIVLLELRAPKR